ncbi:hypothetical protein Tco_0724704, partial [Tanacetum coccineum]
MRYVVVPCARVRVWWRVGGYGGGCGGGCGCCGGGYDVVAVVVMLKR